MTPLTIKTHKEHESSEGDEPKDKDPPKAKDETASLVHQLVSPGEARKARKHSKGEEIPCLLHLNCIWSASSTLAGVKTTRRPSCIYTMRASQDQQL